jgi:hypothetical protein
MRLVVVVTLVLELAVRDLPFTAGDEVLPVLLVVEPLGEICKRVADVPCDSGQMALSGTKGIKELPIPHCDAVRLQCAALMLDERVLPAGKCPVDEDSFAAPFAELRLERPSGILDY